MINKPFCHLIQTVFTGRGLNGYGGDEWFKGRIAIFKKYCISSLLNQTNKDFIHWICFRAEEEDNPITKDLIKYLEGLKDYKFVCTFHGQPFCDDKKTANIGLRERVKNSLAEVEKYTIDKDYVYFTVLDSDDMFRDEMVELIQQEKYAERKVLTPIIGFIINDETKELAVWNHPTCPPYYTIMFPKETFIDVDLHLAYYGDFISHEDIPRVFNQVRMKDYLYCCTVHGGNISTEWWNTTRGELIFYDNYKQQIFKSFGIIYN